MPIISRIGARSAKVRALYASIYAVLILGAVTMIYPFLLMLAGSVKSEADSFLITPYPEFWFDDTVLFQKYAESKHNAALDVCRDAWNRSVPNWRLVTPPPPVPDDVLSDFLEWRGLPATTGLGTLGHTAGARLLPQNARLYRRRMFELHDGDLGRYCRTNGAMVGSWAGVFPPAERISRYRNMTMAPPLAAEYKAFKQAASPADLVLANPEGQFVRGFLMPKYGADIAAYNRRHGTAWDDFDQIRLPLRVPASATEAADWENYVRDTAPLDCLRIDAEAAPAYRAFLARRHGRVETYNTVHGTRWQSLDEVPFVRRLDEAPGQRVDWEGFIKDRSGCPLRQIEIHGPAQLFAAFRQQRRGTADADLPAFGAVVAAADHYDCLTNSRALRREFTTRNYKQVLDYLALHGNGFANTLIYCGLAILTALFVNPLAAYALSRFKLPGTYKILLFCMATMAFPGEVSMIPSFILMKRFPLWPLAGGIATAIVSFLLLERLAASWSERWRSLTALALGLLAGTVLVPRFMEGRSTVSLLNTFAALIIPGAASGYFIFLLKGFFDSLPKELYEAAEIDGAGEWTKFWLLTMYLSKPILAVIALGAFTHAYSAFMMALIIIPDQRMWTIMVWIFQLQSQSHGAVVYASLVLAALPTFLVFALCQNVIIRGIVVPTEK